MSNPNDPIDPMAFLNNAIAHAHAQNELLAANARIKQLEAEVERLRKAGDSVCESPYALETDLAVIEWRAAKDGKANG